MNNIRKSEIMLVHLSDAVDCLYDTYCFQLCQIVSFGFTKEEAFWIHFCSVAFMPWSEDAYNLVPLDHIIKFYNHIYRDEIITHKSFKPKAYTRYLLCKRFNLSYALAQQTKRNESISELAINIGRCALPDISNRFKHALVGMFIINAMPVSQRIKQFFPLGRLVYGVNDNHNSDILKTCSKQQSYTNSCKFETG